ncbi:MAG TPA: MFS transporter [Beijerinckiaceae bacterium]|nr:MFS transporter [Beijerinckiaceae bacterium]
MRAAGVIEGDSRRILIARGLRAFGDGYVAVILPVHLAQLGYGAVAVGAISTATLLGSAALTLAIGGTAHRLMRRSALLAASALMAATGLAFGVTESFWPLIVIAFVGTLNPTSGDVSVFLPLEHTVLAQSVPGAKRTAVFARYSFVGSIVGACGALAAGAVDWLAPWLSARTVTDTLFLLYGGLGLATFLIYRRLSPAVEAGDLPTAPLGPSRRRVYGLAALFAVDSFGGGFVVNSLLATWLFQRFQIDVATTGAIFFVTGLCAAFSFFVAVPLSERFGAVNTMVFTHLPANAFLALAAFAPTIEAAFALLICRSLLSSMDVPVRSAYVMAVVTPPERPAAASVTAVPRSLASAVSPLLSGWLLAATPFGWPLVIGGALKAAYDLALLRQFAKVRPSDHE